MTESKTFGIPIDFELIEQANSRLLELANIAGEEKFSEESVIRKIQEANNLMNVINTLPEGFFKDYRNEFRKWREDIAEKQKPLDKYINILKTLPSIKPDDKNIKKKMELLNQVMDRLDIDHFNNAIKLAGEFDMQKLIVLQSKWLFIKLSWQRKVIQFFTNYIFKFRFLLLKLLAAFISFLITTLAGIILGLAIQQYSDFMIGFIVFIISFFTLDKIISNTSTKIFWGIVRAQTLLLYRQLCIYTNHLAAITQFMKTST